MSENVIKDLSESHKYRTEIPNIIFEIGLKDNQIAVYAALKRSAGDEGNCTKSTKRLAKESGTGERNFPKVKNSLCEINPILKKPLITCSHRISEKGDPDTDLINIVNIWPENFAFFSDIGGGAKLQVPAKKGVPAKSVGGGAKLHPKEEPSKKNPSSSTKKPIDDDKLKRMIERAEKNQLPFTAAFLRKEAQQRGTQFLGKALNRYQSSYINKNVEVDNPSGLLIKIHKQIIEENTNDT